MVEFSEPQIILFVADVERSAAFYATFGFVETFRTDAHDPTKIELAFGDFTLGLATAEAASAAHDEPANTAPNRAVVVLWTDDVAGAYELALAAGARARKPPHRFRERLAVAYVDDLDGHVMHLVRRIDEP